MTKERSLIIATTVLLLMGSAGLAAYIKYGQKQETAPHPMKSESFEVLVKGHTPDIQACYNEELRRGNTKSGKLVVKWLVDEKGKTSELTQELNEIGSDLLYECARDAILKWKFPKNRTTYIRHTFNLHNRTPEDVANADQIPSNVDVE